MWTKFYDAAKLVFAFGDETRKNSADIKALQDENRRLSAAVERMAYEMQRLRDEVQYAQREERHEREKTALRLENALLKFERRLPSGDQNDSKARGNLLEESS